VYASFAGRLCANVVDVGDIRRAGITIDQGVLHDFLPAHLDLAISIRHPANQAILTNSPVKITRQPILLSDTVPCDVPMLLEVMVATGRPDVESCAVAWATLYQVGSPPSSAQRPTHNRRKHTNIAAALKIWSTQVPVRIFLPQIGVVHNANPLIAVAVVRRVVDFRRL